MYKIKETPEDFIVEEIINLDISDKGRYSYFELKKRMMNTEDAISEAAQLLFIPRNRISHCGNKDRRAITTQHISVEDLPFSKRKDYSKGDLLLRYLGQGEERLNLGSHMGNRFTIIVREGKLRHDFSLESLKVKNLFGKQRFSNNNSLIGKAIVKGDFKEAVELIKENRGNYENDVIEAISSSPTNFVGALRKVPKKTLQLFIHAYQSELFNRMAQKEEDKQTLPIIGFGTRPDKKVDDILKEEGIKARDFIIRQIPELSSEGEERDLYMRIESFRIEDIGDKTYRLSFTLGKGSYATVLIDYLFC